MIWSLTVKCVSGAYLEEECIRVLEVDSNSTLYELHLAIQDAVNFDGDHLFEFYAGRTARSRKIVFDEEEADNISLEQVYPLDKGLQLYYFFDFGDSWRFKITKSRKKPTPPEEGVAYPRVIEKMGKDPEQYPMYGE